MVDINNKREDVMKSQEIEEQFKKLKELVQEYSDIIPVLQGYDNVFVAAFEEPRSWSNSAPEVFCFGRKNPIKQQNSDFDYDAEIKKLGCHAKNIAIIDEVCTENGSDINLINCKCEGKTPAEALEKLEILCCLLKKGYILILESEYRDEYWSENEDEDRDDDTNPFDDMFDDEDNDDED